MPTLIYIGTLFFRNACLRHCQGTAGCEWYTYSPVAYECILYKTCPTKVEDTDFVSGEASCEVQPGQCFLFYGWVIEQCIIGETFFISLSPPF